MIGSLANARAITKQLLCDNFRPEVGSDVTSGVDEGGMNVHLNFGDSRSNRFRDIRPPHDDDAGVRRSSHKGKRRKAFCLKIKV